MVQSKIETRVGKGSTFIAFVAGGVEMVVEALAAYFFDYGENER